VSTFLQYLERPEFKRSLREFIKLFVACYLFYGFALLFSWLGWPAGERRITGIFWTSFTLSIASTIWFVAYWVAKYQKEKNG